MVKKSSAGLLVYRSAGRSVEVLLVHPGGPFWAKKDLGSWSIPKGEFDESESAFEAAKREFSEETGANLEGNFIELKPVKHKSGKIVYAWAIEGQIDVDSLKSNTFELEWPPKSRRIQSFPEVDKAGWFAIPDAMAKLIPAEVSFIEQLVSTLKVELTGGGSNDGSSGSTKDAGGSNRAEDRQLKLF
jgi:predicted NUDIX family NTP pyrophosphohydrolase